MLLCRLHLIVFLLPNPHSQKMNHDLAICPLNITYREPLHALANDPLVSRTSFVPHPCPVSLVDEWMASNHKPQTDRLFFAVLHKQAEVGLAMLKKIDYARREAELAYWIGHPYWGRGFGLEAARHVMEHAFTKMDMQSLHSHCLRHGNPASRKILEKLGFMPDPARADLPVEERYAQFFPGDSWMFFRIYRDAA